MTHVNFGKNQDLPKTKNKQKGYVSFLIITHKKKHIRALFQKYKLTQLPFSSPKKSFIVFIISSLLVFSK